MTAGDGLDREAVRRRAEAALADHRNLKIGAVPVAALVPALCTDVFALLDALKAAEARLAESVPRSALVRVPAHGPVSNAGGAFVLDGRCNAHSEGWRCCADHPDVYVLRTEGGAE